jgi:hypothetical protein
MHVGLSLPVILLESEGDEEFGDSIRHNRVRIGCTRNWRPTVSSESGQAQMRYFSWAPSPNRSARWRLISFLFKRGDPRKRFLPQLAAHLDDTRGSPPVRIEALVHCTFTALDCKCLVISGASEWNRTLVSAFFQSGTRVGIGPKTTRLRDKNARFIGLFKLALSLLRAYQT